MQVTKILLQRLKTLPEHPSSPPVFSGVRVTRSLVLYVYFVERCLYFFFWPLCCHGVFDIRILITSLWYLQTFLSYKEDYRVLIFCTIFEIYLRNLSL